MPKVIPILSGVVLLHTHSACELKSGGFPACWSTVTSLKHVLRSGIWG